MKNFIITLCALFICTASHAQTETMNWYVDGETYATTQCESGGDVILPTTPTKRGYTFEGWGAKYTRVEYLESTGTQYIDTGIVPNQNSGMYVDVYTVRSNRNTVSTVDDTVSGFGFGISQDTVNTNTAFFIKTGAYAEVTFVPSSITGAGTGRYQIMVNDKNISVTYFYSGETTNYTYSRYPRTTSYTLTLFAAKVDGIVRAYTVRIYSYKLYDNNTIVRDFVPVLDPNGVACMYDKVSGTFFYNSGTGDFIAGPVDLGEN